MVLCLLFSSQNATFRCEVVQVGKLKAEQQGAQGRKEVNTGEAKVRAGSKLYAMIVARDVQFVCAHANAFSHVCLCVICEARVSMFMCIVSSTKQHLAGKQSACASVCRFCC